MKKIIVMVVVDLICIAAIAWAVWMCYTASAEWFYGHFWILGIVLVAVTLIMTYSSYIVLRPHLLLPLAITVIAATAQAGIFTPAGGDSANEGKRFWWDFGFGDFLDGVASWISGAPTITVNPQPPASSDTSSK